MSQVSPQIRISPVTGKSTWPIKGRGLGFVYSSLNRTAEKLGKSPEVGVRKVSEDLYEISNDRRQYWYKSKEDMKRFLLDWGLNPEDYLDGE